MSNNIELKEINFIFRILLLIEVLLLVKKSKQGHYNIIVKDSIGGEKFITSRF
jgi:hypothetical protein